MATYDVILPAGGRVDGTLASNAGTEIKALIPFEGATIIGRTLAALAESGLVRRTAVVGPAAVLEHPEVAPATLKVPEGVSGPDNIYIGLESLLAEDPPDKLMIVTTDLPFLTGQILQDFVSMCPDSIDICVPLINKASYVGRFPGATATFVPFRNDVWTTGCAYLMDVDALQRSRPHIERVFANRKSKLGMAKMLGVGFILKLLMKRLTVEDVETKIKSMLNVTGAPIIGAPPELAYDIDDLEDYEYAVQHLDQKVRP